MSKIKEYEQQAHTHKLISKRGIVYTKKVKVILMQKECSKLS